MKLGITLIAGSIFLGLSACSSTGPVIYPNTHFLSVGKAAAEKDIEDCRKLAESAGAKEGGDQLGDVASSTAMGAGMGAVSGAAGGAIYGAAGQGSLVGAASGAVVGLLRGILFSSKPSQPSQAYTNFVSRCLKEKGYEVTGWE